MGLSSTLQLTGERYGEVRSKSGRLEGWERSLILPEMIDLTGCDTDVDGTLRG
jgi:hypothetical protein